MFRCTKDVCDIRLLVSDDFKRKNVTFFSLTDLERREVRFSEYTQYGVNMFEVSEIMFIIQIASRNSGFSFLELLEG